MTPLEHLQSCDPILAAAIAQIGPLEENRDCDPHFRALCRIIVGQQLSVAVARAIWHRVEAYFGEDLSPQSVLETPEDELRKLGLSGAKARYLAALATDVREGKLEIEKLESLSDGEIRAEITQVKGLGPWSADIFLMFHLNRPDVLPVGDLGVREAFKRLYHLENRPDAVQMEEISAPWRPHRTLASRYLWRWLDAAKPSVTP